MDIKASARSKHASSKRGRARHSDRKHPQKPTPKQEQPPDQKSGKQGPAQVPLAPSLPSNWSRYDDFSLLDDEIDAFFSKDEKTAELPAAKSRGADYRELLLQEYVVPIRETSEFESGLSSLMFTRGSSLLEWGLEADSIGAEEQSTVNEASILSIDLDFLNRKLAELDLADRLFIDPRLLSEEQIGNSSVHEAEDAKVEKMTYQQLLEGGFVSPLMHDMYRETTSVLPSVASITRSEQDQVNEWFNPEIGQETDISGLDLTSGTIEDTSSSLPPNQHPQSPVKLTMLEDAKPLELLRQEDAGGVVLENMSGLASTNSSNNTRMELADPVHSKVAMDKNADSNKFEARAAEAELDALLDMLETPGYIISSATTSSNPPASFLSQDSSTARGLTPDFFLKDTPSGFSTPNFLGSNSSFRANINLNFGSSKEGSLNVYGTYDDMKGPDGISQKLVKEPLKLDEGKGPSALTQDLDDWLDSL